MSASSPADSGGLGLPTSVADEREETPISNLPVAFQVFDNVAFSWSKSSPLSKSAGSRVVATLKERPGGVADAFARRPRRDLRLP